MRYLMLVTIRIALYAAAGLLALLVLAFLFVQTGYFRGILRSAVTELVAKNTHGTLTVGRIGGNLLTGIVVEDAAMNYEGKPVFAARRIEVSYYLPSLLRNVLYVNRVSVSSAAATLVADDNGMLNVTALFRHEKKAREQRQPPKKGEPLSLFVREVRLNDGSFFLGTEGGARVKVEAIALHGSVSVTEVRKRSMVTAAICSFRCRGGKPALHLRNIEALVRIAGDDLDVERFCFVTEYSSGTVTGTALNLSRPRFDVTVNVPAAAFRDLRSVVPSLSLEGTAALHARIKGPIDRARVISTITYRDLTVRNEAVVNALLPEVQLTAAIRNFHPEKIIPGCTAKVPAECPKGTINAEVTGHFNGGSTGGAALDFDLVVSSSTLNGLQFENTRVTARLDRKIADLAADLYIVSAGSVSIRAGGGSPAAHARAELRGVDLSRLLPGLPRTNINGQATVRMTNIDRETRIIAGDVRLSSSSFAGLILDRLSFDGTLKDSILAISSCSLSGEGVNASLSGVLPLNEGEINIACAVDAADISVAAKLAPEIAAGGRAAIAGTVEGTRSAPRARGTFEAGDISYGPFAAEALKGTFCVEKGGKYPEGFAAVSATNIAVSGRTLNAARVQACRRRNTTDFSVEAARKGAGDYRLAGTLEELGDNGARVTVNEFGIVADTVVWVNEGPLAAAALRGRLTIESFNLVSGGQRVRIRGTVARKGPLDLAACIVAVDAERIEKAAGLDIPLRGTINAQLKVTGTAEAPVMEGRADIANGGIGELPFVSIETTARYFNRELRGTLRIEGLKGSILSAGATVPLEISIPGGVHPGTNGMEADIFARAFDLSFLTALGPSVERAEGTLSLTARISGSPAAPAVKGALVLQNGLIRPSATGVDYNSINGTLTFNNGGINVERLALRAGSGSGIFSGKLSFKGPVDAALALRNFRVINTPEYTGTVYADLRVTGTADEPLITGAVRVTEAKVNVAQGGPKPVPDVQVVEVPGRSSPAMVQETRKGTAVTEAARIDAAIDIPGNAWVRGQGLNAEARGKLSVKKAKAGPPRIAGTITAVRGTYEFRGRLLAIDEGNIVFTGATSIDPLLSAKATTRIGNVTITVTVGGTLLKPEISLASIPVMDESDIISYLLFGQPAGRLSESQGSVLEKTTVNALGDIAARGLKTVIGRELSPDIINVAPGGRSVGIGKYINSRLFVQYEWQSGTVQTNQTFIDYQLSDHFSLHSQVGYEPTEGVDLLWRLNY